MAKATPARVASEKTLNALKYIVSSYVIAGLIALLADPKILELIKDHPLSIPLPQNNYIYYIYYIL